MSVVTLTSDFGMSDSYVGAMKGAVLAQAPKAVLVDITHEVPSQDVSRGMMILDEVRGYFPTGTVHLGVVDPGGGK